MWMLVSGINPESSLFGRLEQFMTASGPLVTLAGLVALSGLVVLALADRRIHLFFLLLIVLTFSGSVFRILDAGSTLLRWIIIALLAVSCVRVRVHPGPAWMLFMAQVILGLFFVFAAPVMTWSMQWGVLLFAVALAAAAVSDCIRDQRAAVTICAGFVIAASIWAIQGVASLHELAAEGVGARRFSGHVVAAGLFVQTGGVLLPFAVWGVMRPQRLRWRLWCGSVVVATVVVLLSSAQRTGTFAGLIGCLPLVARFQLKKLLVGAGLVGLIVLLALQLASLDPDHTEFVIQRFTSSSTTGRVDIWVGAMEKLRENPLAGSGFGSNRTLRADLGHSLHNMYLSVWYDTGLIGLILFVGAILLAAWQALLLVVRCRDPELNGLGRLLLGVFLGIMADGSFSTGASSPSDITTVTLLICMVMAGRLMVLARRAPVVARRVRSAREAALSPVS